MHLHRLTVSAVLWMSLCGCGGSSAPPTADQRVLDPEEGESTAGPPVPALSVPACVDLGGAPIGLMGVPGMANSLGDPMVDSSRDDACPADRRKIGTLESSFDPNGALCCEV